MEGFQEAALLRVNICSALGLALSITAPGPHIPAIAPLSQERAPIDLGTTPDIGSGLPWSAATATPMPRPGREEMHGGCRPGGGTCLPMMKPAL